MARPDSGLKLIVNLSGPGPRCATTSTAVVPTDSTSFVIARDTTGSGASADNTQKWRLLCISSPDYTWYIQNVATGKFAKPASDPPVAGDNVIEHKAPYAWNLVWISNSNSNKTDPRILVIGSETRDGTFIYWSLFERGDLFTSVILKEELTARSFHWDLEDAE